MASWIIQKNLWPASFGYHWDTIGSHEDLVAATVDDVKAFFDRFYVPDNATLVIAGDIDPAATRKLVEKYFAWIPKGGDPKKPKYKAPPPITSEVVVTDSDDVQVPKVFLVWRTAKAFHKDDAPLDITAQVLGAGKNSRLYKRLVFDERLAQEVEVANQSFALAGQFEIDVTPKPNVDPEKLVAIVDEEIARLAKEGPTPEELERARNGFEAGFLASIESLMGRASRVARYDVMVGDTNFLARDLERYRKVGAADVKRVTAKYLGKNARVRLTISPEKK
jgi:zinc protease